MLVRKYNTILIATAEKIPTKFKQTLHLGDRVAFSKAAAAATFFWVVPCDWGISCVAPVVFGLQGKHDAHPGHHPRLSCVVPC